jgi:trans-aconitate methyltransferase
LSQIIKRLEKENPNQTLRWTDLGCGHRIAQREHQLKHPNSRTLTQGIDLIPPTWQEFECQIPELKKASTRRHYRKLGKVPETTVQGDVSTMEFGPSHLITAIEVIQYIEDKLAALCHWYNQLAPGGVMVIATETSWTSWIRIKSERYGENSIIDQFLTKVNHLAQHMSREEPDDISTLIIFKAANHQLISKAKPHHIWINPHGYKATYYHKRREPVAVKQLR